MIVDCHFRWKKYEILVSATASFLTNWPYSWQCQSITRGYGGINMIVNVLSCSDTRQDMTFFRSNRSTLDVSERRDWNVLLSIMTMFNDRNVLLIIIQRFYRVGQNRRDTPIFKSKTCIFYKNWISEVIDKILGTRHNGHSNISMVLQFVQNFIFTVINPLLPTW